MEPDLHESAWDRAKAEAGRIYSSQAFRFGAALVDTAAVALAAALAASAGESVAVVVAVSVLAFALALILCYVTIFVLQLIAAPRTQRDELRQGWTATPVAQPVNVELTLRKYAGAADDRANRIAAYQYADGEDDAWADEWRDDVVSFLSQHATNEAAGFIETSTNATAHLTRENLRARAAKLREIADRRESGA